MRFVTIIGERNLSDLISRIFDVRGAGTAELIRKAERELIALNPHLGDFTNTRQQPLVVIPDVPGLKQRSTRTTMPLSSELSAQLRTALESARSALEKSAEDQMKQVKDQLALGEDVDLQTNVDGVPELKKQLETMLDDAKKSLKEVDTIRQVRTEHLGKLQKELEEFMK